MTESMTLTDRSAIELALHDPTLVPHPHLHAGADGPTLQLRAAMARFSGPDEHPMRRAAVEPAIGHIDIAAVVVAARAATRTLVVDGMSPQVIEAVIRSVPTVAVGTALGSATDDARLVDDVEAIVRVIGRGEPPTQASDAATRRMLDRFAGHPDCAVAAVSVLYQNFDATSALIRNRLQSQSTGHPTMPAVATTRRVTTTDIRIDGVTIAVGTELTLMIGSAELPFGAGPHVCPGQSLATALADAILAELTADEG